MPELLFKPNGCRYGKKPIPGYNFCGFREQVMPLAIA